MDESYQRRSDAGVLALYRIWCCGSFRVERYSNGTYCAVETREWGGHSSPRTVLKALICAPRRRMSRGALLAQIWPEAEEEQTTRDLNVAISRLRKILTTVDGQECLATEEQSSGFSLADQSKVWVDADAALSLIDEAKKAGYRSPVTLPLLEEAWRYFQRGGFLEQDEGEWGANRRAMMERARYRCQLWLADVSTEQGHLEQAETLLNELLSDDPTDEDVVCRLMALLHQRGLTHQALVLYKQSSIFFAAEGLEFSEGTRMLAAQLSMGRHLPSIDPSTSRRSAPLSPGDIVSLAQTDRAESLHITRRELFQQALLFTGTIARTSDVVGSLFGQEHLSSDLSHLLSSDRITPEHVHDFTLLTEVCRRLSEGNELQTAEQILWSYLPRVELLAQSSLEGSGRVAEVASQGYLLAASLVGHRNDLQARRYYSEQALLYGGVAEDPILQVAALRQLATTFNYLSLPEKVLETYQRALPFLPRVTMPSLLRSCIYAALSGVYAQLQQKHESDHFIGLAYDSFGEHQGEEPAFLRSINASENLLIHWAGKSHLLLGQPRQAETVFLKLDVLDPHVKLPTRIRIEAINNRVPMFLAVGNMDQACLYLEAALRLTLDVRSRLRLKEIGQHFQLLQKKWPNEKPVHVLGDLFIETLVNQAK